MRIIRTLAAFAVAATVLATPSTGVVGHVSSSRVTFDEVGFFDH